MFAVVLTLCAYRFKGRLSLEIKTEADALILTRVTAIAQVNIQAVEASVSPA